MTSELRPSSTCSSLVVSMGPSKTLPQEDDREQREQGSWHCVITYPLNFLFIFFLLPYRLKWDEGTSTFKTTSIPLHKFVSLVIYAFHLTFKLYSAVNKVMCDNCEKTNSARFFLYSSNLTWISMLFPVLHMGWCCDKYFAFLATELKGISGGKLKIFFASIFLTLHPLSAIFHYNRPPPPCLEALDGVGGAILRIIWSIIFVWSSSIEYLFESYCCILLASVFLKAKEFKRRLATSSEFLEAQDNISSMKHYLYICNEKLHVGTLMLLNFGDFIISYSQHFSQLFLSNQEVEMESENPIVHFYNLSLTFGAWFLGAEANRLIHDSVSTWLSERQSNPDLDTHARVVLLGMNQEFTKEVGIACRFFTISYGSLSSMLGLLMTYAVIGMSLSGTGSDFEKFSNQSSLIT